MKTSSKSEIEERTLILDLDVCDSADCEECEATCSNLAHPGNNGITDLREQATFAHYCRQCETQACLQACPVDALEKNEDGVVKRANLLCIGCDSCIMACPFGTIYTEFLPFLDSNCDLCEGRPGEPSCVSTCPHEGLRSVPAGHEPEGEDWHEMRDGLFVHVSSWEPELIAGKGGK
ncbi:MAG: 4Fe-4S dicluster domain-containing protein [Candidatus Bipolaricaulota bacterium]|nr:4Fe-4S binding protein [Candidatus Bipolaricaulota bacterium]MBS3791797.1 4Fe-4S binding protein [Candidatus Bipolaricaulota bacterium]